MLLALTLSASLVAAAPGPRPCSQPAPATLDDLDGCQRRALDNAAGDFAAANAGKLPPASVLALWAKAQAAERKQFLKRHPDARALKPAAAAVAAAPKPNGKCLTVYVAPWCPHCREATSTIVELRAWLAARGVRTRVIVGKDSAEAVEDYARAFGDGAETDPEGAQLPAAGVPNFQVTAANGSVLAEMAGVAPGTPPAELAAELKLP